MEAIDNLEGTAREFVHAYMWQLPGCHTREEAFDAVNKGFYKKHGRYIFRDYSAMKSFIVGGAYAPPPIDFNGGVSLSSGLCVDGQIQKDIFSDLRFALENDRLRLQNKRLEEWCGQSYRERKLHCTGLASEILRRFHAAGYVTQLQFIHAVQAVHPKACFFGLAVMYEFVEADIFLCIDAEHALNVLTQFKY